MLFIIDKLNVIQSSLQAIAPPIVKLLGISSVIKPPVMVSPYSVLALEVILSDIALVHSLTLMQTVASLWYRQWLSLSLSL